MTPHDSAYWIGVLFGAIMVGGLCGLLPLLLGLKRNSVVLGVVGFICCLIGGLLLGLLLAAPIAAIFAGIIVATNRSTPGR